MIKSTRAPGFYWTRYQTGRWVPSEWTGEVWRGMSIAAGGTMAVKDDEFVEIGGHIPAPEPRAKDGRVLTVGDLKAVIANEPDELPLAARGVMGGEWVNGFSIDAVKLTTLGSGADKFTVAAGSTMVKRWTGKKSKPFTAIGVG